MNTEEIAASLSTNERHISLDAPITVDGEDSMLDILENPNAVSTDNEINHTVSLQIEIERLLHILSPRQRETLRYLYGIGVDQPLSLESIGRKFNLTRERVRQIKDKAIEKLRIGGNINLLRSYLAA